MSSPVDLRNPGRPIHVGVVLLNTVTEQLDVAPVGFFSSIGCDFVKDLPPIAISEELRAQALEFIFHWVNEDGSTPAALTGNMKVTPTDSFATCPPLDIVVIGASKLGYEASSVEKEFLRKCYADCAALLCVCGGFEPVLASGLLEGKVATAPRLFYPGLKQMAPGTEWVDKRWVQDTKIWTTGALLNGLDMVAAFGRETWGGEGSLVEHMIRAGFFPTRDVDYKDEL
ncbi:class I glutamine amidotransferase-like protein [Aspergillus heteromorphus CBS 117.55]|uniref:Class I glutamine amidotransferase-like protein n=1 Tax=Aspergillus heteromorphus CBS 117.55 TaxID=1448321 RepID=A0A317VM83_9EURO|nr:class I glutamine amidotransferase-like protein [Aspergillus heteromorphus CBS 117.55]PWY73010.1 class I glutamine amidotransferase-like protein [Aspergillus heteromorphus CBS 117.55]